jgi:hypothetical protein
MAVYVKKRKIMAQALLLTKEVLSTLSKNFIKCVKGYHLINDDPIKEAPWEDINAQILRASGCTVNTMSKGSHKPGADLSCSLGKMSNKSTKYDTTDSFKLSSYRLTTVCSDKEAGDIDAIIKEINKRKNFEYYSIIVRNENDQNDQEEKDDLQYDWFLIPSDYPPFDPATYKWQPKIGKIGKNKGHTTGWNTNIVNGSSMSITFSMSSQLWIDIKVTEEMKQFMVGSCEVAKGRVINYIQLYNTMRQQPDSNPDSE